MPSQGRRWMFRSMAVAVLAIGAAWGRLAHSSRHAQPPRRRANEPYRALVSTYCLSCHNSKSKAASARARLDQRGGSPRSHRRMGKGRAQAARAPDASPGSAPSRRGDAHGRADRARSSARQPGRRRRPILAEPTRSAGSTAPNIATPSAICSRSTSTQPRCCRATRRATGSTTSRSATSRRRCSSYVSAAEKISQLAVGRPSLSPGGSTVRLRRT